MDRSNKWCQPASTLSFEPLDHINAFTQTAACLDMICHANLMFSSLFYIIDIDLQRQLFNGQGHIDDRRSMRIFCNCMQLAHCIWRG